MTLLLNFEFILRDGEVARGTSLYKTREPQKRQPDFPGSDIKCDLERVEVVVTTDLRIRPKIFWRDDVFGKNGNGLLLTEERDGIPLDIALIEALEGQVWILRSEPTLDNRIGITISNSKGKVLFTGIGDLTPHTFTSENPDLKPVQGHIFTFFFNEIYSFRRSSPMSCGHTSGADRVSSPAVYPDYDSSDGGYH